MFKKLLCPLLVIIATLVTPVVAQEKKPYCAPFATLNNNLIQSGFVPVYMSADDDFKMGSRFYINADEKAIAVLIIDLSESATPTACLATIQKNLSVRKDVLEYLHRKIIGENT